jgi:hypothetical protein
VIEPLPVTLEPAQEDTLRVRVRDELTSAVETHMKREERFAGFLRAYKFRPKTEKKDFPWPGASNIVVPLVKITIDAVVARLQKAIMGTPDLVEVTIKSAQWEPLEKDIREWLTWFVENGGLKSGLRTMAFDMGLCGDSFVLPRWIKRERDSHMYDPSGNIVTVPVVEYEGVFWHVASPSDVLYPNGFDEWGQLPWKAIKHRYTWAELKRKEAKGDFDDVERIRSTNKERSDPAWRARAENSQTTGTTSTLYEVYEIHGLWEIPPGEDAADEAEPVFEELILTYSLDGDCFLSMIYNPFFGKAHHIVKVPFLNQAHEVQGQSVAEQTVPFQDEASTAHNQKIDAATAANAGIVVVSEESTLGPQQEIYPGARIVTPNPDKDVRILHMSEPGPAIQRVEDQAAFLAEKASGMSSYNLGMESSIVGSRATATGTTALISEGNIRQWVSIDDMRDALAELLYLTIQLEQQYRPEGYEYIPGKRIMFPQGDVRSSLGLRLKVTSEQVNRELELQNLQMLMAVLNEYYMRLSQASMMMFNPQVPPQAKQTSFMIMMASQDLIRRYVERFDVENIETIVPNIQTILMGVAGAPPPELGGVPGAAPAGPPMGPGMAPGGAGGMLPPNAAGGAAGGPPIGAGGVPPIM